MTKRVGAAKVPSALAADRTQNFVTPPSQGHPGPRPLLYRGYETLRVQPKLKVGAVDDPLEREADSVAERVMRAPKCACGGTCPQCRQQQGIQAPPVVGDVLQSAGQPLDKQTRAFMEPRFGFDFSRVLLHSDSKAAESARAIQARAFTAGRHIVFGRGEYNPTAPESRQLLAHELTHVVQGGGSDVIRRAPAPAKATADDLRQYVQATIDFFTGSANFYRDPIVTMSAARFDRLIDDWYLMVDDREKTIDNDLSGDVLLKRSLHAAYTSAIRVLVTKAAPILKKTEPDLYRENRGRIPIWAWSTAHHMEMGISTPIPEGRGADPLTGNVDFTTNGMSVTILPDQPRPSLGDRAQTDISFSLGQVNYQTTIQGGVSKISSFTPGSLSFKIQTFFGSAVTSVSSSGYGRGTTREDQAGGKITPRSTSVGFHEGSHGLDFVEFLENNVPPSFTGTVGMTETAFNNAIKAWETAVNAYKKRAENFSLRRTDCVVTTIDQFEQAKAAPGAKITLVCPP